MYNPFKRSSCKRAMMKTKRRAHMTAIVVKAFASRDTTTGRILMPVKNAQLHKRDDKAGRFLSVKYDNSPGMKPYGRRFRDPARKMDPTTLRASKLFGSQEAAVEWLAKPSRWLDDRSPKELIQAGKRSEVDRYLEQIEFGVYV